MKKKLTFLDKCMLLASLLLAAGLIAGSLAGKYDPRQHILIAFLGLAYPFLLLANLIMTFWWLLRKKWLFVVCAMLVILSGLSTLTATFKFFGNPGTAEKNTRFIRLMTYNVHGFKKYGGSNDVSVKRKMLEVIKEQQPDIICFQEFYTRFKGEFDIADTIKQMLNTPYVYFLPSAENNYEARGMAIFSRYPILNKGYVALEEHFGGNGSIFIDINHKGRSLRIYNLHLRSISFDKQDYVYLDKVKVINPDKQSSKRIYRMLRDAFKKRAEHVALMKAELGKCKLPYVIAGDFNDTPASFAVTQLTGDLNNAFIAQGKGLGRTYNGKFPNFQIDYIASTKDIGVESYHIIEAKLSDHFPVRADLLIK